MRSSCMDKDEEFSGTVRAWCFRGFEGLQITKKKKKKRREKKRKEKKRKEKKSLIFYAASVDVPWDMRFAEPLWSVWFQTNF